MKHLLSIERLAKADMEKILATATLVKQARGQATTKPLVGQTWALIFSKSSTRTRVSFEVGISELGGRPMFLSSNDIQLGRGEPIKDTARVMGRMIHGAVIRTFAQKDVEEFAEFSGIPTINALTDDEHPCQILADIFTFQEKRGPITGKTVAFIGDGACNVANSWIWAAAKLGFNLRVASPEGYQSTKELRERVLSNPEAQRERGVIRVTGDVKTAVADADMLYTDVWVSMGKEAESEQRFKDFIGYQINQSLVKLAKPDALVMHCLPAYRGKEIDDATFEANAQTIFDEAENRLHVQKAIIQWLLP